jgi:L-ascorbate metabolism protein UlaG (beta-lactamase superfamily)
MYHKTMLPSFIFVAAFVMMQSYHFAAHAFSLSPRSIPIPNILSGVFTTKTFTYTHLECNGQLWQVNCGDTALSVVVDPLASQLDFGIPWGYRANKRSLSEQATIDLICRAKPSHCLLTMGLDDHTHLPTINQLRERMPELKYIVAPSAEKKLVDSGVDAAMVTVLKHGQSCDLIRGASVIATPGALVGPPWQERENGFLLQLNCNNQNDDGLSIYYEPHNDVVLNDVQKMNLQADIVIMPVTKQSLPSQAPEFGQFTLVYGGERALEIAEKLKARIVIPLGNGVLDTEGPLATLVQASGDVQEFEQLLNERNEKERSLKRKYAKEMRLERPEPGVPLKVSII